MIWYDVYCGVKICDEDFKLTFVVLVPVVLFARFFYKKKIECE